jgi:pSer/pThr/pTyr-binding forkhead associated (FHA) protein
MKAKFLVKFRRGEQTVSETFDLVENRCTIGRKNCDLLIEDKLSSKQHSLVYLDDENHLRVRDLASRNGTFVNGRRMEEAVINIGDEIRIGQTVIQVVEFERPGGPESIIVRPFARSRATPAQRGMSRQDDGGMKNWFVLDEESQSGGQVPKGFKPLQQPAVPPKTKRSPAEVPPPIPKKRSSK